MINQLVLDKRMTVKKKKKFRLLNKLHKDIKIQGYKEINLWNS